MSIKNHFVAILGLAGLLAASVADSQSAFRKLGAIETGAVRPGSRVSFSRPEIDAWLHDEAKARVPQGVNNLRLDLQDNRATAQADIDFLKVRQATNGGDPGWLIKNLFAGERPVMVTARFSSANGHARVDVERVEISGVPIQGAALDFVIANYVRPTFPDVKVNESFALDYGVDRFTVAPPGVTVFIRARR